MKPAVNRNSAPLPLLLLGHNQRRAEHTINTIPRASSTQYAINR